MKHIIQITAGRGPDECSFVVDKILPVFLKEADKNRIEHEIITRVKNKNNTLIISAVIELKGENYIKFIKDWTGTILWIGKSPFRKNHKRTNWYIGLQPVEPDEKRIHIKDEDLKTEVMRSSGPGGQHANKTSSSVRITHIPSGITAVSSDERSQHLNKKTAKKRVYELLALHEKKEKASTRKQKWMKHNNQERGNPVRVYKGMKFVRIK